MNADYNTTTQKARESVSRLAHVSRVVKAGARATLANASLALKAARESGKQSFLDAFLKEGVVKAKPATGKYPIFDALAERIRGAK
jgi:hypothetical protein